jgi:hypothetical protein
MKLILLNKKGWTPKYCLLDHRTKTDYFFGCSTCKTKLRIDFSQATQFENLNLGVSIEKFIEFGGVGVLTILLQCEKCRTSFLIGIGYTEPNNGRDVFFVSKIIELDKEN